MKILLIEDNPAEVDLFYENLEESDGGPCDVVQVGRLEAALKELDKASFDAVVVDLSLPDSQGLESFQRIQEKSPNTPVIIQTNMENEKIVEEALKSGVQDYIVKNHITPYLLSRSISHAIQRNQARRQLMELNEQLQKTNEIKSKFVSTVSHELRTPMTILMQTIENFADGEFGAVTKTQTDWLNKMKKNIGRLRVLIADILDFSRLQSGREDTHRELIRLNEMIAGVAESFQPITKAEKKDIRLHVEKDIPVVWANRIRLEQLLTNLIANAVRYTPGGKSVDVSAVRSDQTVRIRVEDRGPGLKTDAPDSVFDPFVQIPDEAEEGKKDKGVGLGLAICKEIVVQHKGRIWAENRSGGGCRFVVQLPIDLRLNQTHPEKEAYYEPNISRR